MEENPPSIPSALKNLSTEMRCGILSNAKGEIVIIHDKEISSEIQWVEYNPQQQIFSLIHSDGTVQNLGLKFDAKMESNLKHGMDVIFAHIVDGTTQSTYKATLVLQEY